MTDHEVKGVGTMTKLSDKDLKTVNERIKEMGVEVVEVKGCSTLNNVEQTSATQATPHNELIKSLLDSSEAKTEREHAAATEIKRIKTLAKSFINNHDHQIMNEIIDIDELKKILEDN